jgi:predicted ATP-grasp superfamily ATP-dependent carboligase
MELIERAYGLSIFDLHVRAITQGELPDFDLATAGMETRPTAPQAWGEGPGVRGERFYGKAIVYAEKDGQAPDTTGWPERGVRDVPFPGEQLTRGGPICTVLASAPTRDACFASLVAQAQALTGDIYA